MGRAGLALLALTVAAGASPATACTMADADQAWLEGALAQWRRAEVEELKLDPAPLPDIYAIDGECMYLVRDGDVGRASGEVHGETVKLPGGPELPIGPISFAFGGDSFVMSLPGVWRAAGVESEMGLERLMTGVLQHEIMHVRQTMLVNPALDRIEAATALGDELGDDMIQARFREDLDYVAAYQAERDALFAAANAPDDNASRVLAREGLRLMRERRARWFTGDDAYLVEVDDIFLTMEGMGQWLIYRYFQSPKGGGASALEALKATRRGGSWWTQEEGLAIMLVVDRLLPDWQGRTFREPDWRAENLIAAALEN